MKRKGYKTTCDNFFTSLPVAKKLARNKISIEGTIRKNCREMSSQMTQSIPDKIYHSRFMWHDRSNALFVNCQPKRYKSLHLFSTMHSSPDVDTDSRKQKPNIILFCNKNKVGVDCFDQMTHLYTTRSASRRWPFSVWGNILDIAALNAKILFVKYTGNCICRRQFIFQLMKNLRIEPESGSIGTFTSAVAVPAANPDCKRKKWLGKSCDNATTCLCLSYTKTTYRTCSVSGSKVTFVKCKGGSSRV